MWLNLRSQVDICCACALRVDVRQSGVRPNNSKSACLNIQQGWRKQISIDKHVCAHARPLATSIGTAVALPPTVELLRPCFVIMMLKNILYNAVHIELLPYNTDEIDILCNNNKLLYMYSSHNVTLR